ncbi:hypothetical protein N7488_012154 [Penicillium malachiteum]|nr:hypothetical protein N7488_012154 [Penicillium malachiteum]
MTTQEQEKKNAMKIFRQLGNLDYFLDQVGRINPQLRCQIEECWATDKKFLHVLATGNSRVTFKLLPNANNKQLVIAERREAQPLNIIDYKEDGFPWRILRSICLGRESTEAVKLLVSPRDIGGPKTGNQLLIEWIEWAQRRKSLKETSTKMKPKIVTSEGQDLLDVWSDLVELNFVMPDFRNNFLHTELGVKKYSDIDFLLDILKWRKISSNELGRIEDLGAILRLYRAIHGKLYKGASCQWIQTRERIKVTPNIVSRSFFEGDKYIFAFDSIESGSSIASWFYPRDCWWKGPDNMITKKAIEPTFQSLIKKSRVEDHSYLFVQDLDMVSASWPDLVSELEIQREQRSQDFTAVSGVYNYIHNIVGLPVQILTLRSRRVFQEKSLILATKDSQPGWYKSSKCLWSGDTEQPGKAILKKYPQELKTFFVETLGAQSLTMQMMYDDLLQISTNAEIGDIKSKLRYLSLLISKENCYFDPEPLIKKPIFPVVYPDGTKTLQSASVQFAIVDREYLASYFRKDIKTLDFTQEEVRNMRAFFEWTGLSSRYLSVSVEETSYVCAWDKTRPWIPPPNRDLDFKHKAHAILCVAAMFNCPRYHANKSKLFRQLKGSKIRKRPWAKENIAKPHIEGDESRLNIFIPDGDREQELCLGDFLPIRLIEWLMEGSVMSTADRAEMVKLVKMIFSVGLCSIDQLLNMEGVTKVDIPKGQKVLTGVPCLEKATRNDIPQQHTENKQSPGHISKRLGHDVCEANKIGNLPQPGYTGTDIDSTLEDVQTSRPTPNHSTEKKNTNSLPSQHADLFRKHLETENFLLVKKVEDHWYETILSRIVPLALLTNFPSKGDLNKSARRQLLP